MSYQVLARKYRPQRFSDVIGQDHVTRTLRNAIEQQRIAHGYIFSGHRGIGKTTIARIMAMALNCRSSDHPVPEPCGVCDSCVEIREGRSVDVIEIDAATNRGIDEIRELREAARYRPARDRYKIYILDEAHQITDAAFNALLKTLEEPPPHIIFMMATTQPEDIPQTIRSRCQHFAFHAVCFDEIVDQLRAIAQAESVEADDNALALLAEAGDGSMRDALSIMDQAIACCGQRLTAETVRGLVGAVPSEILEDIMGAVEHNSSEDVLKSVDKLISEGHNPAHFAKQLVRFLRNAIVAKVAGANSSLLQISQDEAERVGRVAEGFSEEDLTRFLQIMLRTHGELGYKQEQRFHLELGLLKMVHAQRLLPMEELLSGAAGAEFAGAPAAATERPRKGTAGPRVTAHPMRSAADTGTRQETAQPARVRPFEADLARKRGGSPENSVSAAAGVAAESAPDTRSDHAEGEAQPGELSLPKVQVAILAGLRNAGQTGLADRFEEGEWKLSGTELVVAIAVKESLLDKFFNAETRRTVGHAASQAAGQPVRVRAVSNLDANGDEAKRDAAQAAASVREGNDARSRAAQDPVVRRMMEKFGAEIRTVVDYRDKR